MRYSQIRFKKEEFLQVKLKALESDLTLDEFLKRAVFEYIKQPQQCIQVKLTEEQFIIVKKAALDAKMSLDDFLRSAVFEKLFLDLTKKEVMENQSKE